VTGGWQDNQGYGGGQEYGGGWQPQQDPYAQPQYGPPYDPYGQYPQQQQDPYQNYPGWGEPPPPKKSKLPIVLSIIAIVAIVGGVVAIVLLNRNDDPKPAADVGPSTTNRPATPSKVPPLGSNTRKPPSSGAKPPTKADFTPKEFADKSGGYATPADWQDSPEPKDSGIANIQFSDVREVSTYDCGGSKYFRGFSASTVVQSKTGAELDPNKVATDFANAFATKYYGPTPKIDAPTPTSATVGGKKGATLTAKVTVTPTKPECEATNGEVAVVTVPVQGGVRVLVVVDDLVGGPANPKPLPDSTAEDILASLSVN
jgi:hypothetical protein